MTSLQQNIREKWDTISLTDPNISTERLVAQIAREVSVELDVSLDPADVMKELRETFRRTK